MVNTKRIVQERPILYRPNMTIITNREKVTYYARVSTDHDEQEESYERQQSHFKETIAAHPEWEYVEGYADQGITGTKAEERPEFMRMIEDCRKGMINRILVKSISRFARNTVDTLKYIRELKELGISVYFETQHIDTMTSGGEVLITILAAMAEQESRTMSTNIKWSYQKRFKDGRVLINYKNTLGYDKVNDEYVIVEKEAEIIRSIFRMYLSGKTIREIANYLNEKDITTKRGSMFKPATIQSIIDNEKYTGNAILGKSFKVDVLSKTRIKNEGQAPSYYVENSHPAIISQEIYDRVQAEKKRRAGLAKVVSVGKGRYSSKYVWSGILICSSCGSRFRRHNRSLVNGTTIYTWVCPKHQSNKTSCNMKPIKEEDLINAYKKAIKELVGNTDEIIEIVKESITEELVKKGIEDIKTIQDELQSLRNTILQMFKDKLNGVKTPTEYIAKYEVLSKRVIELESEEIKVTNTNAIIKANDEKYKKIIEILENKQIDYMDDGIIRMLLETIRVIDKHRLEFQFNCGVNIKIEI